MSADGGLAALGTGQTNVRETQTRGFGLNSDFNVHYALGKHLQGNKQNQKS